MDGNIGCRNYRRNYLVTLYVNKMKETEKLICILIVLVLVIAAYICASTQTEHNMQKEAIAAGVARWEVNATNGTTTFVYIKK